MPRILMVTAEAAPFAKTGGLADVLGALPPALVRLGEEVGVVMPRYDVANIPAAERVWHAMPLVVGPHRYTAAIDQVAMGGVRYWFVDCPPLYNRGQIYGNFDDNHVRFAALNLRGFSAGAVGVRAHLPQEPLHLGELHQFVLGQPLTESHRLIRA